MFNLSSRIHENFTSDISFKPGFCLYILSLTYRKWTKDRKGHMLADWNGSTGNACLLNLENYVYISMNHEQKLSVYWATTKNTAFCFMDDIIQASGIILNYLLKQMDFSISSSRLNFCDICWDGNSWSWQIFREKQNLNTDKHSETKLEQWLLPQNKDQVASLLGTTYYYYSGSITDYVSKLHLMIILRKKTSQLKCTPQLSRVLNRFRKIDLFKATTSILPIVQGTFYLDRDATKAGLSGTMRQIKKKNGMKPPCPVYFGSQFLNPTHEKYGTSTLEMFETESFLPTIRSYLTPRTIYIKDWKSRLVMTENLIHVGKSGS